MNHGVDTTVHHISYLIYVDAHGGQQKGSECNGNNETVGSEFAGNSSESPLTECREQYMRWYCHEANHQVSYRKIQYEDVDSLLPQLCTTHDGGDYYSVA